jgi:hypothetical protein
MRFSTVCGTFAALAFIASFVVPELSCFFLLGCGVAVCLCFLGLAAEGRI